MNLLNSLEKLLVQECLIAKYLEQANNNLDEAVKLFRSESGKKAEKKGSRIAAEGIVNFYENSDVYLF